MLNPFSGTTIVGPWERLAPSFFRQSGRFERIGHFDCDSQKNVCFQPRGDAGILDMIREVRSVVL
jgi:hypothetical protein